MTHKKLAIFGIVAYILNVIVSATNEEGIFLFPVWLIIIAGAAYILFHILALKRTWKAKFESRLLLISYILSIITNLIVEITSPIEGSFIIVLSNMATVVHFIAYFLVIAFIWGLAKLEKEQIEKLKRFGCNSEDIASIKKAWEIEDKEKRDAMLQKISDQIFDRPVQKYQEATGINLKDVFTTITPEVGREFIIPGGGKVFISWSDILNHVFRVLEFERANPFGYLIIESPILNAGLKLKLPIFHPDDFSAITKIFDNQDLYQKLFKEKSLELLVVYAPEYSLQERSSSKDLKGLSLTPHHVLHYVITPYGTLDKYYSMDNNVHFAIPDPQKLFGPFIYEGEITVKIKPEIKL